VGDAVLVPGNRCAESRLLDEKRFVERHEVVAVDRRGDRQQLWMAVDPQSGFGELQ
jgi:hypothetical protein